MPAVKGHNSIAGIPHTPKAYGIQSFKPVPTVFAERNYTISGVTKDSTGAALGTCIVKLFFTVSDVFSQQTTSDASGNYSFAVNKTATYYVVSYKAGAPDVAGTTVNTLAGA